MTHRGSNGRETGLENSNKKGLISDLSSALIESGIAIIKANFPFLMPLLMVSTINIIVNLAYDLRDNSLMLILWSRALTYFL